MDMSFTPEQEVYRQSFRRWLADNLAPDWGGPRFTGPADDDENCRLQKAWEQKLYAAGYQGIHWPREYGGQSLSLVEHLIVSEELGRVSAPEGINTIGKELVGPIILAIGTEQQKRIASISERRYHALLGVDGLRLRPKWRQTTDVRLCQSIIVELLRA
jgi:alkylation response protein AidB-like acyl-CoA dehydrogenase